VAEQTGVKVFAAEVVDEIQLGLALVLDFAGSDDPTERIVDLAQKSRQLAVKGLSGHFDILIVEINIQVNLVLIII
jgi:hypothetical protein